MAILSEQDGIKGRNVTRPSTEYNIIYLHIKIFLKCVLAFNCFLIKKNTYEIHLDFNKDNITRCDKLKGEFTLKAKKHKVVHINKLFAYKLYNLKCIFKRSRLPFCYFSSLNTTLKGVVYVPSYVHCSEV